MNNEYLDDILKEVQKIFETQKNETIDIDEIDSIRALQKTQIQILNFISVLYDQNNQLKNELIEAYRIIFEGDKGVHMSFEEMTPIQAEAYLLLIECEDI